MRTSQAIQKVRLLKLRTSKQDRQLLCESTFDGATLHVGARNLHVVYVEKVHVRMD
jgi:hypothetical protein